MTMIPDAAVHPTTANNGNYLSKSTEIIIMKNCPLDESKIQSQVAQLPKLSHLDLANCGLKVWPTYSAF